MLFDVLNCNTLPYNKLEFYRVSQKDIVFRKIAKPLIKRPFRGVKGRNGGSHKFRHIRDMSDTPSYGIDVLSNPKYPYFDNSNTSKQEFCYIPKDNIFLGHPVLG